MKKLKTIVIVGADSYLATGLDKYLTACNVYKYDYNNWADNIEILKQADCVINFCIAPEFSTSEIDIDNVIDIQIAKKIRDSNTKFIFISSRKVYGISDYIVIHKETDKLYGQDYYAINKIKTEKVLNDILGNKLTVLRVSNIIGEPVKRKNYKTFVGWISEEFLNNDKLTVYQNSKTVKDFITKKYLHKNIEYIAKNNISGIFNLSSGFGTSIKEIIMGYVGKEAVFIGDNTEIKDQFILDNTKIKNITKLNITKLDIYRELNKYKKQLFKMKNLSKENLMDKELLINILKYPISRTSRNFVRNFYMNKKFNDIKLVMTLLVKNEEDIIETNIRYHKAMGIDGFIVTSHNSSDRTDKILQKLKQEGLVLDIIYEKDPVYHQSDFVDRMIKLAKNKYKADWIINADADEFYYSKSLNLKESIKEAIKADLNVIWVYSIFSFPTDAEEYLNSPYFVTKPFHQFEANALGIQNDENLQGFIGVQPCTKVIHNTKDYNKIYMGNHDIKMKNNNKRMQSADIILYHYHIRNYKQQEEKILRYIDTEMPKGCGTHMQKMIDLYKDGKLREDFDSKYGIDVRNYLIEQGVVSIDRSVSNFLKYKCLIKEVENAF